LPDQRRTRRAQAEDGGEVWFDCLVGCAVAANLAGATLPGVIAVRKRKRERVDFREWQRRAREGR